MRKHLWKVIRETRTSAIIRNSSKYCITYEKNEIAKSLKGTLGIFCFKRKKDAIRFINFYINNLIIIKVRPLSIVSKPKFSYYYEELEYFYLNFSYHKTTDVVVRLTNALPQGTVCCDSVLVLE